MKCITCGEGYYISQYFGSKLTREIKTEGFCCGKCKAYFKRHGHSYPSAPKVKRVYNKQGFKFPAYIARQEFAKIRRKLKYPKWCFICKKREKLFWHHKDKNKYNNRRSNLVAVCLSCHRKLHPELSDWLFNPDTWVKK